MNVIHEYSVDGYYHRLIVDDVAGPWASLHQVAHMGTLHACAERLDSNMPRVFRAEPILHEERRPTPVANEPSERIRLIWDLSAVPVEQRIHLGELLRSTVDGLEDGPFLEHRCFEALKTLLDQQLSPALFERHEIVIVAGDKGRLEAHVHVA